MTMKIINFLMLFFILNYSCLFANNDYSVVGFVKNMNSDEGIGGARVYVEGTNVGTYTSMTGLFKLPFLVGKKKIKISSIGYKSKVIEVDEGVDTVIVKLEPVSIKLREAIVIGNIEANEVIKRAITKKDENKKLIKTFKALLYSKLVMELDGSVFGKTDGKSFSLAATLGDTAPDKYKMFLLETFSRVYMDYDRDVNFSEIIQRRQTSNIKPADNLLTLGNILDFSKDEIKIANTYFISPISEDAFDYYEFEILEKDILDDKYIYVLNVKPKSDIYPLFEGIIKIVEGEYQLIEIDLKPTKSTKIVFVKDLHFIQKFEKSIEGLWAPRMFELTGKANVDVVKGMMDLQLDLKATSIYSDINVNVELPDSIYNREFKKTVTVSQKVDSIDYDYWEKNSMREITEKEKQMYAKVDSLIKLDSTGNNAKENFSDLNYSILNPFLDFNRVSSVTLGLSPEFSYKSYIKLDGYATFSFGLQKVLGSVDLSWDYSPFSLTLNINNNVEEIGSGRRFSRILNTVFASLFHYDYYDYYYNESYGLKFAFKYRWLNLDLKYSNNRDFILEKTTNRSIFSDYFWRENVSIDEGHYGLINTKLNINGSMLFHFGSNYKFDLELNYMIGQNLEENYDFNSIKTLLEFEVPTFFTGYAPMMFTGRITYAKMIDVPLQYSERIDGSLTFIKSFGSFGTIPLSMYEREEFLMFNARYSLSDLWWRWLGLPTYEGRGLDLIFTGSTGRFKSAYLGNWYSELGFSLERIPTFISNVIYFGIGFDWGIGRLAAGKFGFNLQLTLPVN